MFRSDTRQLTLETVHEGLWMYQEGFVSDLTKGW